MGILAHLAGAIGCGGRLVGHAGARRPQALVADASASRLRRMEARYRMLVEQIPAVTFIASFDDGLNEIYVSPQIEALLGYTQEEWLSDPVLWFRRLHPDDRALWSREFARGCLTGGPFHAECRFLARDGSIVWVRGDASILSDERGRALFLQGLAYDITENKRAEEAIQGRFREKETLLKEIHHRVKNNLQMTSSLLHLQAARIKDEAARRAIAESQGRIRAIALVHDMLYRSADLSLIDFSAYLQQLVKHLAQASSTKASQIAVDTEIDDVGVTVDRAVPCGLLVSELVTNCFKHAFPCEARGRILVRLRATAAACEIEVRDDGVGFGGGADPTTSSSLGLALVQALVSQLHGRVELSSSNEGTMVHVTLPADIVQRHG
jgi:PAS domain S-box-containing protein